MPQGLIRKISDALDWRLRKWFGDPVVDMPAIISARWWRKRLRKTRCIAITGSVGKTTTKELLVHVLSGHARTIGNAGTLNVPAEVAKLLLRTRNEHRFCISEIGAPKPGAMDAPLGLFQPQIGIVTVVGDDHWSAYQSHEAIAQEKGKLVAQLPEDGVAILNADDPFVRAMATRTRAKVLTYGASEDADVRMMEIGAAWPQRLTLNIAYREEAEQIKTQLAGSHMAIPILAAVAGGIAAGLSLKQAAGALATAPPFTARMQPVTLNGIDFIRDDFKAPFWTMGACLDFVRNAQARRKYLLIGTLSDVGARSGDKYAKLSKSAQGVADTTIFIGPWAFQALKARHGRPDAILAFSHVREAARYLRSTLREGDLVVLKGSNRQDHLYRLILDQEDQVACWRDDCKRDIFCSECPHRMVPSHPPSDSLVTTTALEESSTKPVGTSAQQLIVGLGNDVASLAGTPHNVGYEVVEHIASRLGMEWHTYDTHWIAQGEYKGTNLCVVKIRGAINDTGPALRPVMQSLALKPADCILVYDDLELPVGTIRARINGGAGGHRGVASILEAYQTDAFRRVKLGVGQTGVKLVRAEYVVKPFDQGMRTAVDSAVANAAARALEMVAESARLRETAHAIEP